MSDILLKAENLSITFGGLKAVQDVSLSVRAGTLTALVGPNGAGKTTLFGLLSGFLTPGAGRVEFLLAGPSSAGMSNEVIAFVRAYDLVREHAGGGDHTENIVVHEVPRHEAPRWLLDKARAGYSIDPKLFAGLYFLDHAAELFCAASS